MGEKMEELVFQLSADGTKLLAVYTPAAGNISIDETSIRKTVDLNGFSNLLLFDNACAELAKKINDGNRTLYNGSGRKAGWRFFPEYFPRFYDRFPDHNSSLRRTGSH